MGKVLESAGVESVSAVLVNVTSVQLTGVCVVGLQPSLVMELGLTGSGSTGMGAAGAVAWGTTDALARAFVMLVGAAGLHWSRLVRSIAMRPVAGGGERSGRGVDGHGM
jgi:hypothetical protein